MKGQILERETTPTRDAYGAVHAMPAPGRRFNFRGRPGEREAADGDILCRRRLCALDAQDTACGRDQDLRQFRILMGLRPVHETAAPAVQVPLAGFLHTRPYVDDAVPLHPLVPAVIRARRPDAGGRKPHGAGRPVNPPGLDNRVVEQMTDEELGVPDVQILREITPPEPESRQFPAGRLAGPVAPLTDRDQRHVPHAVMHHVAFARETGPCRKFAVHQQMPEIPAALLDTRKFSGIEAVAVPVPLRSQRPAAAQNGLLAGSRFDRQPGIFRAEPERHVVIPASVHNDPLRGTGPRTAQRIARGLERSQGELPGAAVAVVAVW